MKKIIIFVLISALTCTMFLSGCSVDDGTDWDNEENDKNDENNENKEDNEDNKDNNDELKETPISDFEFEAGDKGMIVTAYKGSSKKVSIPAVVENKKVIDFNENVFAGNIVLEEITLPEHMTTADTSKFAGCDNLKKITYLGNIISYGTSAKLLSLDTIAFPNTEEARLDSISGIVWRGNTEITLNLDISGAKKLHGYLGESNVSVTISKEKYKEIQESKVKVIHSFHKSGTGEIEEQTQYIGGYVSIVPGVTTPNGILIDDFKNDFSEFDNPEYMRNKFSKLSDAASLYITSVVANMFGGLDGITIENVGIYSEDEYELENCTIVAELKCGDKSYECTVSGFDFNPLEWSEDTDIVWEWEFILTYYTKVYCSGYFDVDDDNIVFPTFFGCNPITVNGTTYTR